MNQPRLLAVERPTDVRATPQDLFNELNKEFQFTLDVCAQPHNAKCEQFYSPNEDGLASEWSGNVWCNPPYSEIYDWVAKGEKEIGRDGGAKVAVFLLPSRTGTAWFHEIALRHEIRFLRGRVKFNGINQNPTFDSLVLVMREEASK